MQTIVKKGKSWKFWTTSLLALTPFFISAQKITYVDTTFGIFIPKTVFGEIDLGTCTDSIVEIDPMVFSSDVAVQANGDMYGYGLFAGFDTVTFFSLDTPGTIYAHPLGNYSFQTVQGLTCDENEFIYEAGKGIVKRNVGCCGTNSGLPCCNNTNYWEATYLGDLPPGMECLGDITYRKGKFYLSAIGNKLVEVNMKDISQSQIVMEFPPGTLPIHGLTTVQLDCDSVVTYAIGRAWDHSIIYEVDFNNWTLTQVCDMPLLAIDGAGNKTECALPPCDLFVDLDNDNSSMAFWGNYCANAFCLPPAAVTDTDVVILSMSNSLDSLVLELTGVLDGPLEYLETDIASGSLSVVGDGTSNLVFYNNGTATIDDFEDALKSVIYHNDAAAHTYGMRKVRVVGWSGGVASIVSTAELPLDDDVVQVTFMATAPNCYGQPNGSLEAQTTGGTAPYTYQWQTGQTDSLLTGLSAGIYLLTVTDNNGCASTAQAEIGEYPPIETVAEITNATGPVTANGGVVFTLVFGGSGSGYAFSWSNGTTAQNLQNVPPGTYSVTVTDSAGCTATFIFEVDFDSASGEKRHGGFRAVIVPNPSGLESGAKLVLDKVVPGMRLRVFDVQGRLVASGNMTASEHTLPTGLAAGTYWVVLDDGYKRMAIKWVVAE